MTSVSRWDDERTVMVDLRTHSGALYARKLVGREGEMRFVGALDEREAFLQDLWQDAFEHGIPKAIANAEAAGHIAVDGSSAAPSEP